MITDRELEALKKSVDMVQHYALYQTVRALLELRSTCQNIVDNETARTTEAKGGWGPFHSDAQFRTFAVGKLKGGLCP